MRCHYPVVTAALLAVSLVLGSEGVARADVPPPDTGGCTAPGYPDVDPSKVGAACQTDSNASGTCTTSKCSRVDYGSWDRDASPTPPSVEYDCLRCTAGASTGGDGGATSGDGGATSGDGGTTGGSKDDSGCNVSGTARSAAPWLLALAAALAVSARRKRNAS